MTNSSPIVMLPALSTSTIIDELRKIQIIRSINCTCQIERLNVPSSKSGHKAEIQKQEWPEVNKGKLNCATWGLSYRLKLVRVVPANRLWKLSWVLWLITLFSENCDVNQFKRYTYIISSWASVLDQWSSGYERIFFLAGLINDKSLGKCLVLASRLNFGPLSPISKRSLKVSG